MADKFVCTENPEHVHPFYSGDKNAPDAGKSWYSCDVHAGRIKAGYYDAPYCPDCVCGHPAEDHPTTPQRWTGQVYTPAPTREKYPEFNDEQWALISEVADKTYSFPVWHHAYEGDGGPCQEPAGMHKLVGFLCIDCGAQLEGMPTKATPEEFAEVLAHSSPTV